MNNQGFLLQALSPLHVGTGQAVDIIDLPIARMKSTNIPYVPGSSIKGVLRENCKNEVERATIFGPSRDSNKAGPDGDSAQDLDYASALVVSDARLLALPVRSFKGTFCFVSSPMLLHLWKRDAEPNTQNFPAVPTHMGQAQAFCGKGNINMLDTKIYLEDLDLPARENESAGKWAEFIQGYLPESERDIFARRFVVVDDETMSFLYQTAMQIDTRIRIDPKTGVVAQGALWTEESLPSETLLVGMLSAYASRRKGHAMSTEQVLKGALGGTEYLQFGGKATVGRGRCRIFCMQAKGV